MPPLIQKVLPQGKRTIEVIRDGFVSPVLGRVYIGKQVTLDSKTAGRLVRNGVCKYIDGGEEEKVQEASPDETPVQELETEEDDEAEEENTSDEDAPVFASGPAMEYASAMMDAGSLTKEELFSIEGTGKEGTLTKGDIEVFVKLKEDDEAEEE